MKQTFTQITNVNRLSSARKALNKAMASIDDDFVYAEMEYISDVLMKLESEIKNQCLKCENSDAKSRK